MTLMINSQFLQAVEMAVFSSASMTGSYQALNDSGSYLIYEGNGFQAPVKMIKILNQTTQDVTLSFDGTTANDFVPAGSAFILDCQTNHSDNSSYGSGTLNGRQGQIIYGLGTAGTGSIYIIGYL